MLSQHMRQKAFKYYSFAMLLPFYRIHERLTTSIIWESARPNVTFSGSDVLPGMTGLTLLSYPVNKSRTNRCSLVSSRSIPGKKEMKVKDIVLYSFCTPTLSNIHVHVSMSLSRRYPEILPIRCKTRSKPCFWVGKDIYYFLVDVKGDFTEGHLGCDREN